LNGKNCPSCNCDIGMVAIIKAAWPTRIKCPSCKTNITYKPLPLLLLSICLILYFSIILFLILNSDNLFQQLGGYGLIVELIFIVLLWQPFEIVIAKHLREKATLVIRE